jgi:hypothetical protein
VWRWSFARCLGDLVREEPPDTPVIKKYVIKVMYCNLSKKKKIKKKIKIKIKKVMYCVIYSIAAELVTNYS